MAIDDGIGGCCRVCGTYHLSTDTTVCTGCLVLAMTKALRESRTISGALIILRDELLKGVDADSLYADSDAVDAWEHIVSKL